VTSHAQKLAARVSVRDVKGVARLVDEIFVALPDPWAIIAPREGTRLTLR
jgi:hypothetical protein